MEKLEERRMARVYTPEGEFSLAQHGNHRAEEYFTVSTEAETAPTVSFD